MIQKTLTKSRLAMSNIEIFAVSPSTMGILKSFVLIGYAIGLFRDVGNYYHLAGKAETVSNLISHDFGLSMIPSNESTGHVVAHVKRLKGFNKVL
jgi:hypothetical protein